MVEDWMGSEDNLVAKLYGARPKFDKLMQDFWTLSRIGKAQPLVKVSFEDTLDQLINTQSLPDDFTIHRRFGHSHVSAGAADILTLLNVLIDNALSHHDRPSGNVWIETRLQLGQICLSVRDDGPGIPRRFQQRVFEMMSSLNPPDKIGSHGMGLAIARKIVSHYGGSIRAECVQEARGAHIIVLFPKQL